MPLRIIPERREAPEHRVQSARAKGSDVFGDDVARAEFADEPRELKPESRTRPFEAGAFTGEADILTGEAAANNVGSSDASARESIRAELAHVAEHRNSGPMLIENRRCVGVLLTECDGAEPAGAFESK